MCTLSPTPKSAGLRSLINRRKPIFEQCFLILEGLKILPSPGNQFYGVEWFSFPVFWTPRWDCEEAGMMIPDRLPYVKSKQPGQSSHNLDLSYSYLLNQNKFLDGLVQKPQLSQRPEASRLLEQPNSLSVSAIAGCPHSCIFLTIKVYCSNIPTRRHYLSCKILLAAHLGMKSLYFTL